MRRKRIGQNDLKRILLVLSAGISIIKEILNRSEVKE